MLKTDYINLISATLFFSFSHFKVQNTLDYYFGDYSDPDQQTTVHPGVVFHGLAALRKPGSVLCCL